jgi:putative transposase
MARLPRLVAPGLPHHVILRGNNRQSVFSDQADCERFLTLLVACAAAAQVEVHGYVLMTNHVHLVVTPASDGGPAQLLQSLGRGYVRWFNHRHARTGTLWEGRYRSAVIEAERYLLACLRYMDLNPVRAGLVDSPAAWRWSSHAHHIGQRSDPVVSEHALYWALGNTPFERQLAYRRLFESPDSQQELSTIRKASQSGWALGSERFAEQLTESRGRRASSRAAGRPRKLTPSQTKPIRISAK